MSSLITELDIRSIVFNAVEDFLGVYRYANGSSSPAFTATDGSAQADGDQWNLGPEVPKVEGLEVVLALDTGAPSLTPLLQNGYWIYRNAEVSLRQFDRTKTVREACRALIPALNLPRIHRLVAMPRLMRMNALDNVESQTLMFQYPTES